MSYERLLLWIVAQLHYCGVSRPVRVKLVDVAAVALLSARPRVIVGTAKKRPSYQNRRAHRMIALARKCVQHCHVAAVSFYFEESVSCGAVKVTVSAKSRILPQLC